MNPHPLTIFVYESFGKQFGDLLLLGYRAEPSGRRRRLYLTESATGTEINWVIELIARRLPCRDEPLVLAALLKLMLSRSSIARYLEFDLSELLVELQWPDKTTTRQQVETAIRGYVRLLYDKQIKVRTERRISEIPGGGYYHLLTGYVREVKFGIGEAVAKSLGCVYFDVGFIKGLSQGRVYFAGIDFGLLQSTG